MRLFRAEFPARSTCLWHEHRRYTVYICVTELVATEFRRDAVTPSELSLPRGSVFCRDHSQAPLIHAATTGDQDVVVVGIERWHPTTVGEHSRPSVQFLGHMDRVKTLHSDTQCSVYEQDLTSDFPVMKLCVQAIDAVVVALDACELIATTSDYRMEPSIYYSYLKASSHSHLHA
ncbi:hypothetical protein PINS_up007391 [Pythium insidiosum]|nr:hypothetical protein PINS_up007391 [Pythium insidiosum]